MKVGRIGAVLKEENGPVRKVKIGNSDMDVLIDTGATANVMDEEAYKKLFPRKHNLKKATSIMQPYHTDENPTPPLCIIGKFDTVIESRTRIVLTTFYVVKGKTKTEPLLSYRTAQELDMINIIKKVEQEASKTKVDELLGEYSDIFEGIGKMKGVKVDLNIDDKIEPTAQPCRRIPFSVRPKL